MSGDKNDIVNFDVGMRDVAQKEGKETMSARPGKHLTRGPQNPALGLPEPPHVKHISAGTDWLLARANSDQRLWGASTGGTLNAIAPR